MKTLQQNDKYISQKFFFMENDELWSQHCPDPSNLPYSSKPLVKSVNVWTEDSIESLKIFILCTDWDICHELDVHKSTLIVTDNKCWLCDTQKANKGKQQTAHHNGGKGLYQLQEANVQKQGPTTTATTAGAAG